MKNWPLNLFLGCAGVLLWSLVACRAEPETTVAAVTMPPPVSPAATLALTATATTMATATASTIPTATASPTAPPTATALPSPTPFFFDEVTHQLAVSDGQTLIWLSPGSHQVLAEAGLGYPDFSPDGRYIAYVTQANSFPSHLIISDVLASAPLFDLVFAPAQFVLAPDWSPDSQQLVFTADLVSSGQNPDLYTIALDDPNTAHLLFSSPAPELEPAWSPDGETIAFVSSDGAGGGYDLYLINSDGSNLRPITLLAGDEREPAWSPDGEYLAFVYEGGDRPVATLAILARAQFGEPDQQPIFLDFPADVSAPIWSEDGELISFVADPGLYVTDLAGVSQPVLASSAVWHMDWRFNRMGVGLATGD